MNRLDSHDSGKRFIFASFLPGFLFAKIPFENFGQLNAYYSSEYQPERDCPFAGQLFFLVGFVQTKTGFTMTRKSSLKKMKDILIERRDALRQAINGDDSLLKKLSQQSGGDVVDFASDSASGEISSRLAEVENRELKKVEIAITKMQEGTYGKCDGCNSNIPIARLQALPYAAHCIKCKLAAEKAGVEPGEVVDWALILDADSPSSDMDFNLS